MRKIFSTLLVALLLSPTLQAAPNCVWALNPSLTRLDDFNVRTATACLPSGNCLVILDKPSNRPRMSNRDLQTILGPNGLIRNYEVSNSPAVNCHAFSCQISGIPNFPKNAWIDTRDLLVLLEEFFTPTLKTYSYGEFQNVATDPSVQEGDLVLMRGYGRILQHSGVIQRVRVGTRIENWVLSKLDEGATVLVPLANLAKYYPIDTAMIRRRK